MSRQHCTARSSEANAFLAVYATVISTVPVSATVCSVFPAVSVTVITPFASVVDLAAAGPSSGATEVLPLNLSAGSLSSHYYQQCHSALCASVL